MKLTRYILGVFVAICTFDEAKSQNNNQLIPFASGLTSPVCITHSGDDRLFVANQRGIINTISSTGVVNTAPFLDIRDRVVYGGERGLLGIAFHPQYRTNGYFYVNYIGAGDSTRISRFSVNPGNPEIANPGSEYRLMTIFQPYANHNGGDLKFGADGYLYIGLGDGGSGGDPGNRAQNHKELLGKILRIDIDHGNPYAIPTTNPFYNSTTTKGEIWAIGLRNPWRFSFDRITNDMWIADVGQNSFEEINFQPAASNGGKNYGWRCYEGNQAYSSNGCAPFSTFTFPVYTYPLGDECSITGGYVYRGSVASPFYGHYFFADYCSDRIWTLQNVSGNWVKADFGQFSGNNFSTFGEDVNGQLYVAGISSGKIFRIADQVTQANSALNTLNFKLIQHPSTKIFNIETYKMGSQIQVSVYDIMGKKQYQTIKNEPDAEIDLTFLKSGMYFLKVTIDDKSEVRKIMF
jgi:glucose/arabinose dehydrogenase